ncbi:single-stranded DNA-binding protein [Rhizohabitans arisaemae]|uniref:single-stranded DNA-binding protein n=1 Tax=Rhizohabitans arisaemae TaxID=2720610 RepID=UPI0024B1CCC4|nr:single-stranded DNA-binding protein [Rhizohabitans arisaemae]
MNETYITVVGNVTATPKIAEVANGVHVLTLRVASTPRKFDRQTESWKDGNTVYLNVRCWRQLADHVHQSVRVGQRIIAHGRLNVRSFEDGRTRRVSIELEAVALGHDLRWGVSTFSKADRAWTIPGDSQAMKRHDEDTGEWAQGVEPIDDGGESSYGDSSGYEPPEEAGLPAEDGEGWPDGRTRAA